MNFLKGIIRDLHPSGQPESTYRDARNIVIKEKRGAVSNEPGTSFSSLLPFGYTPIGKCVLPDKRIVVFLSAPGGDSEIGLIDTEGQYKTLVNDPRLNFSEEYPIQATARVTYAQTTSQQFSEPVEFGFTETDVTAAESVTLIIS